MFFALIVTVEVKEIIQFIRKTAFHVFSTNMVRQDTAYHQKSPEDV